MSDALDEDATRMSGVSTRMSAYEDATKKLLPWNLGLTACQVPVESNVVTCSLGCS